MSFSSMLSNLKRNAASIASTHQEGNAPKYYRESNNSDHAKTATKSRPAVSRIYLACPPHIATGGPNALHQLCNKVNSCHSDKVTAYMLYLKVTENSMEDGDWHRRYSIAHVKSAPILNVYDKLYPALLVADSFPCIASHSEEEEEYSSNLIIWPECWTHVIDLTPRGLPLPSCRLKNQTAIWWLSVDNNNSMFKEWHSRNDIIHLYQSHYAREHIYAKCATSSISRESDNQILPMTEYIPISLDPAELTLTRDLDVLFNPLKGIHYTDEIRKRSRGRITFTSIGANEGKERITSDEVNLLLRRAKVYIDFGPHPGMDRLPREAALADCIVITNCEGAARFQEDVPIPDQYKVKIFDVEKIHRLLVDCLENYETKSKDFDFYRKWIRDQETQMEKCVRTLIDCVCGGKDVIS